MHPSRIFHRRLPAILLSSVAAFSLALTADAMVEEAPTMPLTASFGAGTPGENSGPHAVTLTNTSKEALSVTATITFSVQSHNRPQTKVLPPRKIAAGASWKIDDLAMADRIVLTADGYAPMALTTPSGTVPLSASFGAGTPGENSGPYAVTLKNTSKEALSVTATITFSVQSHNRPQTKVLPAKEIPAGGSWTINDLAVQDKVVLMAEGYAPLELITPPGK